MKRFFGKVLLAFCFTSFSATVIKAQNYTVNIPVYDTMVISLTNGLLPCPTGYVSVTSQIINAMPTGVSLYFKITGSQVPSGCLNITSVGVMNVGDSVQITTNNNQFEWSASCGSGTANFIIYATGIPTVAGDSFYCKTQWYMSNAVVVDGCALYNMRDYFPIGGPPACIVDSFLTTSIDGWNENDFSVYPNPSNGILIFKSDATNDFSKIEIYNSLGEIVYAERVSASSTTIDLSSHSKGIYFLQIKSAEGSIVKKLILE